MVRYIKILVLLCISLYISGCAVYSSANMARIHSDSVTVLGPWGYVHAGQNTSIDFYTGRQTASKDAVRENGKIDWPPIVNVQADSNSNLNIGKPVKNLPTAKVVTTEESQSGIIGAAAKMMTK